ncbi:MAG: CDP-diacylglycerol--glycerol-3-phosphate 3-phosphatidyltransferase [Pseudomonadota bacterium]
MGLANQITLARIALIGPLIIAFTWNAPWNMTAALVIFTIAALTDFVDGWIARRRNEVSALGAALDPIADKLLVATVLVLLVKNGVIGGGHVIAVLIILLRELFISGLREAVARTNNALPVTGLAKGKTTFQLIAAGLFLAIAPGGVIANDTGLRNIALIVLWVAALLTFWTGLQYAMSATRLLTAPKRTGTPGSE